MLLVLKDFKENLYVFFFWSEFDVILDFMIYRNYWFKSVWEYIIYIIEVVDNLE